MKKVLFTILCVYCFVFTVFAQDSTMTVVGPGVKYHSVKKGDPYNIKILEIDISNPNIKIETVLARDVLGTGFERTSSMAIRSNSNGHYVLGAINADFFGISTPTDPYSFLGSSMVQNYEFNQGKYSARTSFGLTENKTPLFNILTFTGKVKAKNNKTIDITNVNQVRATNSMVLYNKYIGANTLTNQWGVEVKIEPIEPMAVNKPVKFVVLAKEDGVGSMSIGDYYVLSGHDSCARFLRNQLSIGDTVELTMGTNVNLGNIFTLTGGGPRLLTNGVIPNSFVGSEGFDASFTDSKHPRSAVGINKDSTKVFFVAVDGRQPSLSVGMTLSELAAYMKSIGCYQALNLDGGGSTALVVRNQVVNSPSDGSERSVGNALLAVLEAPVINLIDSFSLSPRQLLIDSTQTKKITITGIDHWGYPIEVPASIVNWQVVGINGYVNNEGFFVPQGTGSGKIIGTINSQSDTISVTVLSQQIPTWSYCATLGNLPTWFSTTGSTERGFAYGYVNGNNRLYLVSRPNIYIIDAATGDVLGNLSTTGTSGGTYTINDIEVSDDGIIIGANLTTTANTSAFKVYKWNNELSDAETIITYNTDAVRLGDKITVVGSFANNSAVVYAVAGSSNKVYRWTMDNGLFNQTPTVITLQNVTNLGTSPAVYPRGLGNANIFVNGNSTRPTEYTPAGVQVATVPTTVVDSRSNSMRYIESGDQKYLIVYQYGLGNENAKVLDITGGLNSAIVVETSPTLGSNSNTIGTSGDVDFRFLAPGRYIYYVLATNNGYGAYQLINEAQLPVELVNFSAAVADMGVMLNWTTATEQNNLGFEIERKTADTEWKKIGFVAGNGNSTERISYMFIDKDVFSGKKYLYRLKQLDYNGSFNYSTIAEIENSIPTSFELFQNYPNPFNPTTTLKFSLPTKEIVRLSVYNILGQEVMQVLNETMETGIHNIVVDASNFTSGVYFCNLKAGGFNKTIKMNLVK